MAATPTAAKTLDVVIIDQAPHDPRVFTQGLYFQRGDIYESSGLYGKSFVRRYRAGTGEVTHEILLPKHLFAEGITLFRERLYLLTWKARQALVLDPTTLKIKNRLSYTGDGWGLTHNASELIMSDGSDTLYFRDEETFQVKRTIVVKNKWRKFRNINELEYAQSFIWANIWQSPLILKVSPDDGEVVAQANLRQLVEKNSTVPGHTVLNGIAYDKKRKAFWVTGKFWPSRYLIKFQPQ